MSSRWVSETKRAIQAEQRVQEAYERLMKRTQNPRVKAVMRDLLLMEEMNEVLLKTLNRTAQVQL